MLLPVLLPTGVKAAAFATEDGVYTITVNSEEGHQYVAYQLFRGNLYQGEGAAGPMLSNVQWGSGVDTGKLPADISAAAKTAAGALFWYGFRKPQKSGGRPAKKRRDEEDK